MKALYVPVGLLALILALSLWTGAYTDQRTNRWIVLLEKSEEAALDEDWTAAERWLTDAQNSWRSSETFFHTIMDHALLDEADSLFAGALAVCREQDNEDFHMLLAQLICQLRSLAETQDISIKNVL